MRSLDYCDKAYRIFWFILAFCIGFIPLNAQRSEADYSELINLELQGRREVTVTSGRVDILTDTHAFEVEWANKWKHAIGQALWYGLQTTTKPGIVLIMRDNNDYKYYIQLNTALEYAGLQDRIEVLLYPRDFSPEE